MKRFESLRENGEYPRGLKLTHMDTNQKAYFDAWTISGLCVLVDGESVKANWREWGHYTYNGKSGFAATAEELSESFDAEYAREQLAALAVVISRRERDLFLDSAYRVSVMPNEVLC